MKPVLHTLGGTGTPHGFSFFDELVNGCERRARLNIVASLAGETRPALSGKFGMDRGTVFHAFQRLYHLSGDRTWSTTAVRFDNISPNTYTDRVRKVGETLFRAYRVNFAPNFFGTVLDAEKPRNMRCREYNFPVSIQCDLEVKVTGASRKRILRTFTDLDENLDTGIWNVDFKSAKDAAQRERLREYYQNNLRFPFYSRYLRQELGAKVRGTMILVAFEEPIGEYDLIVLPYHAPHEPLQRFLDAAYVVHTKWSNPAALDRLNTRGCHNYWGDRCPYLNKECDRT